jgi:hypothetical protein
MTNAFKHCLYAALALLLCVAAPGQAQEEAARATMINGMVTVASGDGAIRELQRDGAVGPGDIVSTAADSYAALRFSDGTRVLLRPNSRFVIDEYEFNEGEASTEEAPAGSGRSATRLLRGGLRAVTGAIARDNPENVEVRTPVATLGIRGTDLETRYCNNDCSDINPRPANGLYTGVNRGRVAVVNEAGEVVIGVGEFSFTASPTAMPTALPFQPRALGQSSMPDPATCGG